MSRTELSKWLIAVASLLVASIPVVSAKELSMQEVSKRWSCAFEFPRDSREPKQGLSCQKGRGCDPVKSSFLVHDHLVDFVVDLEAGDVRWRNVPMMNPAVRGTPEEEVAEIVLRTRRGDVAHVAHVHSVIAPPVPAEAGYDAITTIVLTEPEDSSPLSTLTLSQNGKHALFSSQGAALDTIWTNLYFGQCRPM